MSKKKKKKNRIFDRFVAVFGHFGGFWPFLDIFWPFSNSKVSEIVSYTCLQWPTTWATLHSARIMQKCAQNVHKHHFLGQFWPKNAFLTPGKIFFCFFLFRNGFLLKNWI